MGYEDIIKLADQYIKASKSPYYELRMLKLDIQYMADYLKSLEKKRSLFREDAELEDKITETKLELYSLKDALRHKSEEIQNGILYPRAIMSTKSLIKRSAKMSSKYAAFDIKPEDMCCGGTRVRSECEYHKDQPVKTKLPDGMDHDCQMHTCPFHSEHMANKARNQTKKHVGKVHKGIYEANNVNPLFVFPDKLAVGDIISVKQPPQKRSRNKWAPDNDPNGYEGTILMITGNSVSAGIWAATGLPSYDYIVVRPKDPSYPDHPFDCSIDPSLNWGSLIDW